MRFNYQARTKAGELKIGNIEASSYGSALDILQKYGYFVTFLEEAKKEGLLQREVRLFKRITRKDIVFFTRQLSILLLSQVPPVEALHTLAAQTTNSDFKDKILKIASDVEGGKSFSRALANYPKLFSSFYINMVKSGEASGNLPQSLDTLATHIEREYDLLGKLKGAAVYPSFVLFVMVVLLTLMLFFVFPELEKVFSETGKKLPLITVLMLNLARFLRQWGLLLLIIFLAGIGFLVHYIRTSEGKEVFDSVLLKIPFFKKFFKKIYLARFAENLATLIAGGLPIAQAMEISASVVGNTLYKKIILKARDGVRRGESISSIFRKDPEIIPPLVTQMIFVGERTGQLDKTLGKLSSFYKKEVDSAIEKFISLLEPILIVFLGLIVATVILTILLPIYQIGFM